MIAEIYLNHISLETITFYDRKAISNQKKDKYSSKLNVRIMINDASSKDKNK